ncbi:putative fibrillin-1 [Apostichopus japonicus]|uniref:Putative fibrillin-1 n=1 Tax=Stichopus japonicus TaxID=307972 RepID=A0A2G8KZK5_STIJA|nr:putative fibrillin-1 [Apostichopus japonicus]
MGARNNKYAPKLFEHVSKRTSFLNSGIHSRSSYPYPHSWFLDYLPAVAPFWADAEIALGYSNVYYQANTFQAVLLTDGRYSFALFNYQECEMNWNVQALSYPNVIIGHNSRGSNGYGSTQIQNSLPFSSTLDKFRPDLLTGNTGLKGKWEFRLEDNTETTVNSKQFCLDWYYQEPSPYQWTFRFDPCPPSYWQARRDWRYIRTSRMYDMVKFVISQLCLVHGGGGGWVVVVGMELLGTGGAGALLRATFVVTTLTPNPLITGTGHYFKAALQNVINITTDGDLTNTDMKSGLYLEQLEKILLEDEFKISTGCLFQRKIFYLGITAVTSPGTGTSAICIGIVGRQLQPFGTGLQDGVRKFLGSVFHVIITCVSSEDFGVLKIQRKTFSCFKETERAINRKTNQTTQATVFNAFAAVFVNATKVQIGLDEMDEEFEIYLDDEWFNATRLKEEETYNHDDNGTFLLRYEKTENSSGITALWDSGISVTVEARLGLLDVVFSAPELYRNGSTRGLLGVWNGDSGDDFLRRDDVQQVPANGVNLTERELYEFGESWRVKKADSLFHTSSRRKRADDESETFKPIFLSDLVEEAKANDTEFYNEVLDTCGSNTECQYDSLATKDAELGASSKVSQEVLQSDQKSINNFPPNITGDDELWAEVGQVANYSFEAVDLDGDEIHVSLIGNVTNATLTDSSVSWIPSSIDIVILAIQASDNQSSSVLEPAVKICDCKNNGSCLWDSYTQTSDIDADKFAVVVCNCTSGWTGDFCEKDLDACEDEPCYPGVSCFDEKPPSENATCGSCPENLVGDGFQCYDADECAAKPEPCEQICDNILGGYACSCRKGYSLSLDDSATCLDEDECELNTHNCDENAFCTNTEGSFQCNCTDGYYGDGFNCTG